MKSEWIDNMDFMHISGIENLSVTPQTEYSKRYAMPNNNNKKTFRS